MSHEDSNASPLEAPESLVRHQERKIAELNDCFVAQWRKIDALERQAGKLLEENHHLRASRKTPEPPPHY